MKNMGDGRRIARIEREVQETIAQFLIRGFKTPIPSLLTVASVKMNQDLRTAKVYVSVLAVGEGKNQEAAAIDTLQERAFEIQNFIGKELKMRYCPKLTFIADRSTDHVLKVEKILHELEQERIKNEPPKLETPESDDEQ